MDWMAVFVEYGTLPLVSDWRQTPEMLIYIRKKPGP